MCGRSGKLLVVSETGVIEVGIGVDVSFEEYNESDS